MPVPVHPPQTPKFFEVNHQTWPISCELTVFSLLCQAMKQRDEDLAREVELLKHRIATLELVAKDQGIGGIFNFKRVSNTDDKAITA